MAGLPCDVCQEESIVIPVGVVGEDAQGTLIYRRYRVCVNPRCEKYRLRRESVEMYLPGQEVQVRVDTQQLRQYLPPEPNEDDSQPSLFSDC